MGLLTCIDCGKQVSDRIQNCPHCGCPISASLEQLRQAAPAAPVERPKAEPVKLEICLEAEIQEIASLLTPAIADIRHLEEAYTAIDRYFKTKYEAAFSYNSYCQIFAPIQKAIDQQIKLRKDMERKADFQLKVASRVYEKQMSQPIQGMGFSVITTDFISAATYAAISASTTEKQLRDRTTLAVTTLCENLKDIRTQWTMSESELFQILQCVGDAARTAQQLAQIKYFIHTHWDFYSNKALYDLGHKVGDTNIYDVITRELTEDEFVFLRPSAYKQDTSYLDKLEAMGYITILPSGNAYVTTTKLEQDTLQELYFREHPEEHQANAQAEGEKAAALYAAAEAFLAEGNYYEAAVNFSKCAGYKKGICRSVAIWNQYLLKEPFLLTYLGRACALKEDGTVYAIGSSGSTLISTEAMHTQLAAWTELVQIGLDLVPYGLRADGTVATMVPDYYRSIDLVKIPCVLGCGANWHNVTALAFGGAQMVGLHTDGTVSAVGQNEYGQCNVQGWSNIVKVISAHDLTAGLRSDGTVVAAGWPSAQSDIWSAWTDIVDISATTIGLVGLKKDGTVVSVDQGKKDYPYSKLASWRNVVKLIPHGGDLAGLTKDGCVLYFCAGYNKKTKDYLESQQNVVDITFDNDAVLLLYADGSVTAHNAHYTLSSWQDIVFLTGDKDFACGVTRHGQVLFAGSSKYADLQEMATWKLFEDINTVHANRAARLEAGLSSNAQKFPNNVHFAKKPGLLKKLFGKK